ncbi:hypothetical protein [Pedobacter gandavensis]|uniref:hypothetical protein n=1 Tax=Pedobacter gandavensis TaxID=2679963 RepID=UPI00292E70D8|nr:hypothetical protein [Pedobacter gandavensis]
MTGCSLVRNTKKAFAEEQIVTNKKTTLKLDATKESVEGKRLMAQFRDSSGHSYAVEIWPKGSFSFDNESGFSGEATKVLISGKQDKLISGALKLEGKTLTKELRSVEEKATERLNTQKREKLIQNSPSWKYILALFVLTALAFYWLRRHFFKF